MEHLILTPCRLLFLSLAVLFSSCFKKQYDVPADLRGYDPRLPVTHSIAQLLRFPEGIPIDPEVVVSGIVVMDDRSGNYYKKIVVQDSTGGIEVLAGQNNLYNDYPVGRKVYLKCRGLYLGADGFNPQLGYTPDAGGSLSDIPGLLLDDYIVKASFPHAVIPDTFSLSALSSPAQAKFRLNTLVAVKNAEFVPEHAGQPYAQPAAIASVTSLTLNDCDGGKITLRNSGYARFQPYLTPAGRGTVCGIYTRYNNAAQLYIRDTTDLGFYSPRCNGDSNLVTPVITVDSLRRMFTGSTVSLPPLKIRGIVISDKGNGNVSAGNVIFQGGSGDRGIILYYGSSAAWALGDSLEVTLTGCSLKAYNGKLEVEGLSAANTLKLGTKKKVQPRQLSVAGLLSAPGMYESTLVMLRQVSFPAGAATYNGTSGNLNLTDATGTIRHYCNISASFKDEPLPAGPVSSVTGYVDLYGGVAQLRIRRPGAPVNDVVP